MWVSTQHLVLRVLVSLTERFGHHAGHRCTCGNLRRRFLHLRFVHAHPASLLRYCLLGIEILMNGFPVLKLVVMRGHRLT